MARRKRRFSKLNELYKELKGVVPTTNTRLVNYEKYIKGETKINQTQIVSSADRKRFGFALLPFNTFLDNTVGNDDRYVAAITKYSNDGRVSVGLSDGELGYSNIAPETHDDGAYYPALIRFFVKANATAAPVSKISDVTKDSYKRYAGKSFSCPFGRTSTAPVTKGADTSTVQTIGEENLRKSLTIKLRAVPTVATVSYEPEVFRSNRRVLVSPT